MNKAQLVILIKQYTEMLNDVMKMMEELKDHQETELYKSLYSLGNDITQQLDDFKHELRYA